jgi:hypothetical protein
MSEVSLEDRVTRLEKQMDVLVRGLRQDEIQPGPHEWIESVGMFRGDPVVKEMIDEASRSRSEQRQRARQEAPPCTP